MPKFWVHDGTAARDITRVWVHDGTAPRDITKIWVHDGTAPRLVWLKFVPGFTAPLGHAGSFDMLAGYTYAEHRLWIDPDGTIRTEFVYYNSNSGYGSATYNGSWGLPLQSGIGANYYIKVTRNSGVWTYADSDGGWLSLSATRNWALGGVYDINAPESKSISYNLYLSTAGSDATIIASATNQSASVEIF